MTGHVYAKHHALLVASSGSSVQIKSGRVSRRVTAAAAAAAAAGVVVVLVVVSVVVVVVVHLVVVVVVVAAAAVVVALWEAWQNSIETGCCVFCQQLYKSSFPG